MSCPVHTQTAVQSLGIRSMQPLSQHIASATDFVAWIYPRAPKGTQRCNSRTAVHFTPGDLHGHDGTKLAGFLLWRAFWLFGAASHAIEFCV